MMEVFRSSRSESSLLPVLPSELHELDSLKVRDPQRVTVQGLASSSGALPMGP